MFCVYAISTLIVSRVHYNTIEESVEGHSDINFPSWPVFLYIISDAISIEHMSSTAGLATYLVMRLTLLIRFT